jgi:hypothetical protein
MKPFLASLAVWFSLSSALLLLAADQVADAAPEAKAVGPGWKREKHLLIEDLNQLPKTPDTEEGKTAAEMFAMVAPMLKARKVIGAGNWFYELPESGTKAVFDAYFYRFANEADAGEFWDKAPARNAEPYAAGDRGQLASNPLGKVLTFRRKNFYVKITVLGSDAGLAALARAIDTQIAK